MEHFCGYLKVHFTLSLFVWFSFRFISSYVFTALRRDKSDTRSEDLSLYPINQWANILLGTDDQSPAGKVVSDDVINGDS